MDLFINLRNNAQSYLTGASAAHKMRGMSDKFIPEHIDPFRYGEQNLALSGVANIADMKRLSENLSSNKDTVTVDLQFGVDEQRTTYLKGHIEAKLSLQCQRCMEPFKYEIMSDFLLGIVSTLEKANALPEHYEPALAKEGQLALRELVEDELILNLPIIPRHEPQDCKVKLPVLDVGFEQGGKENPFHVLKSLKDKRKE